MPSPLRTLPLHFAGNISKVLGSMRILRYPGLKSKGICGSRTGLHRLREDDPTFPQPVAIAGGIGWIEDEIDAWIAARPRVIKRVQASTVVKNKAKGHAA
jgi:predicted DNA-binding transcriptional regulator AlpA